MKTHLSLEEFRNFFKYYAGEEHQDRAIETLYEAVADDIVAIDARWVQEYRKVEVTEDLPPAPEEELVGKSDLAYIWNCAESLIKDWEVEEMNECFYRFDITTPERIRHFLSQTAHESGGGKWMRELSDGWYLEGRTDIGNVVPGDGPKYKGAGYLQLTGRANYEMLMRYTGDQRVMEGVDYVADTYPFTSAGAWWEANRMNDLIDSGASVEDVTRRVNGGYNGLDDRKYYYNRCLQVV